MNKQIKVMVVDDHSILRAALVTAIRMSDNYHLSAEASTAAQMFTLCRLAWPDVVVMDWHLPDMNGVEATMRLRQEFPESKIIITARYEAAGEIHAAVKIGARGFELKHTHDTELMPALQAIASGLYYFPWEFDLPMAPVPKLVSTTN